MPLATRGRKYALTRHNIGFMVADGLAQKLGKKFKSDTDYQWFVQELDEKELVVVKPLLYMNNSGVIVKECLKHFSVLPQAVVVVCDDFALPLGRIRIRERGNEGGHQGLASIIYHLATNDFPRLRIGIGNPLPEISYSEYVLAKFTAQEKKLLPEIIERSVEALLCVVESGIRKAMTLYNAKPAD